MLKGGYVHNIVLLDPIERSAQQLGAECNCEAKIRIGERTLYGDLLIELASERVLVEAELSPKRIVNDLAKAEAFRVRELWLVVPNPVVGQAVRRRLQQLSTLPGPFRVFVLSLPQALERLANCFALNSWSIVGKERKRKQHRGNEIANVPAEDDAPCL